MKQILRYTFITLSLLLFITKVNATIHTVKQDGTGDYTTIQAGINEATTGDTVLVWPGTYFENVDYNSKSITVASLYLITLDEDYISTTSIDGSMNGSCVTIISSTEPNTVLCGFTIQYGSGYSEYRRGGGIYINDSQLNIDHCYIVNCFARSGGGVYCKNSFVKLSGSLITKNKALFRTGGILLVLETTFIFDTLDLNSVFLNDGQIGCDIGKTQLGPPLSIVLDTASVANPDNHFFYSTDNFGYPVNDFSWQINHGKIEQVNANLYVSPEGDNNYSGLIPDEPLQSIAYALKKILPDTISPKSIYLSDGIYSSSSNNEFFPVIPRSFVSLMGSGQENTIIDAENLYPLLNSFLLTKNITIKDITFKRGIDSHEIVGGTGGLEFYDNDNVTVQNITITETHGRNRSALNDNLSSIRIDNSHIYNNNGGNPLILGNTGQIPERKIITNSIINNNIPGELFDDGYGGGVGILSSYSFPGTTYAEFINVLISENIQSFEPGMGNMAVCGLSCIQNPKVNVINSTIGNNEVENLVPSAQVVASEGAEINFYNSIIHGTEDYEVFLGDGQSTSYIATINISNTNVKGGEENIQNWNNIHNFNWLDGNINQDPLWVGAEPNFYALQDSSPCINAGVPMYETGMDYPYIKEENEKFILYMLNGDTITLPATDLAGNPRISGGRIDMGAYEFQEDTSVNIQHSAFNFQNFKLSVYPNPFKSNTFISFSTTKEYFVNLEVINLKGERLRTIANNRFPSGDYRLVWNGEEDDAYAVVPGTYLICLYLDGMLVGCEKVMRSK